VAEATAGLQDARHLVQEAGEVRVAMRRFDVEDDIERGIRERQPLRVADDEAQAGPAVFRRAEPDAGRIEVEAHVRRGGVCPV